MSVEKPGGGTEELTLVDDGLEGDRVREDGLYEGVFPNVAGDGDYTFNREDALQGRGGILSGRGGGTSSG